MQSGILSGDAPNDEANATAVAWPAVIAGASVATAVSISLLFLGSAFGFASVSPWHAGPRPLTFTALSAIWLIIMQWVSSAFGGYITGRMRTKWTRLHTDEVFFRDTANGFLAWAVATIATAILAASVLASVISGGAHMAEMAAPAGRPMPGGSPEAGPRGANAYFIDTLFRADRPSIAASAPEANAEAGLILMNGVRHDGVPPEDRNYLVQLVMARAGISQADAERRVDTAIDQVKATEQKAKEMADTAHKSAAALSLFAFLSLLVGAFIACVGAAVGGRTRDSAFPV